MNNVTAVVLSPAPVPEDFLASIPPCVDVLNHVSTFSGPVGHKKAWLAALARVETEWFFFLDSDDQLPPTFPQVLEECLEQGTPVVYTDEMRVDEKGNGTRLEKGSYAEMRLVEKATLLHHLVLCKTELAQRTAKLIPVDGVFAVEPLIFFVAAKEGISYVPQVGYLWHVRSTGNSKHPDSLLAQINSRRWCYQHLAPFPAKAKSTSRVKPGSVARKKGGE